MMVVFIDLSNEVVKILVWFLWVLEDNIFYKFNMILLLFYKYREKYFF